MAQYLKKPYFVSCQSSRYHYNKIDFFCLGLRQYWPGFPVDARISSGNHPGQRSEIR